LDTTNYHVRVDFVRPLLGTCPANDAAIKYLTELTGKDYSRGVRNDDVEDFAEDDERATYFARDAQGHPVILDRQINGFLREAAKVLNGKVTGHVKNLRSKVENTVFVAQEATKLHLPTNQGDGYDGIQMFSHFIRRYTPFGSRMVVAQSEMIQAGAWFDCDLMVVPGDITEAVLSDLFDYGWFKGMLQWRNGGYGKFRYKLTKEK